MFIVMNTRLTSKLIYESLFTVIFLLIVFAIYLLWERTRSPIDALNEVDLNPVIIKNQFSLDSTLAGKRLYADIELLSQQTDTIRALISFPMDYESRQLPVVTLLGGHRIARQNYTFISEPGDNIIVIFIYPYQVEQWEQGHILTEIPRVRRAILKTPGQIVELENWLNHQSWTDTNKVALLGYSFGALFLPATKVVAQCNSIKTGPCILAYGGADFELLLYKNLKIKPGWLKSITAWLGSTMIYTVDPIHYASEMAGDIYLINGSRDKQIPKASWQLLHNLIKNPAKIDILDEGHMHPRKPELTQKLVALSRSWLKEQGILY